MISIPDTNTLKPKAYDNDGRIALFPSQNTDLVKIDFLFEAGSAYQVQPLCASAASKLYTLATRRMDSAQVSEFMDFRGIIIETSNEVLQSVLTVYTLRRHVGELPRERSRSSFMLANCCHSSSICSRCLLLLKRTTPVGNVNAMRR